MYRFYRDAVVHQVPHHGFFFKEKNHFLIKGNRGKYCVRSVLQSTKDIFCFITDTLLKLPYGSSF